MRHVVNEFVIDRLGSQRAFPEPTPELLLRTPACSRTLDALGLVQLLLQLPMYNVFK